MEFTTETKPNSAPLGEFPRDEHFFYDTLNVELMESFLTNNSGEQILYPGTAQSE